MEWPPTAATEREVNMGEDGKIGWLRVCFRFELHLIRTGPSIGDRIVAS